MRGREGWHYSGIERNYQTTQAKKTSQGKLSHKSLKSQQIASLLTQPSLQSYCSVNVTELNRMKLPIVRPGVIHGPS